MYANNLCIAGVFSLCVNNLCIITVQSVNKKPVHCYSVCVNGNQKVKNYKTDKKLKTVKNILLRRYGSF